MYFKRKIAGSQRIQIIIFIIKNHCFIFKSIPHKRQGSESISILLEYLKNYFHKVEFSVLLKTENASKSPLILITSSWSGIIQLAPPHTENFAKQKTVQIHGFSTKNYQQEVMSCYVNIQ